MPRVSLIVPAYNAEGYIEACLDSLCAQTEPDLEILVIDDGSADDTGKICRYREEHDPRIRTFHQLNAGACAARNVGLAHATGDVVMFCDADDWLDSTCCERVLAELDRTQADVCTFGFKIEPPERMHPSLAGKTLPKAGLYELPRDARELMFYAHARPFSSRMALRAEFVRTHNLRFDPALTLGEDQHFCFASYARASRVALLAEPLYHYRMAAGSLTHSAEAVDASALPSEVAAKLEQKTNAHLAALAAIMEDAQRTALIGPADKPTGLEGEFLRFALDLMLFDASKLPLEPRRALWQRWLHIVAPLCQGKGWAERLGVSAQVRACMRDIEDCAQGSGAGVSRGHLIRYFVAQRGFWPSVRRFLWRGGN